MAPSFLCLLALLLPQGPAAAPAAAARDRADHAPLLVFSPPGAGVFAAARLGDGGVVAAPSAVPPTQAGDYTSTGGVRVQARREGVKLTFASGRELLFTPSGFLHLRGGEESGPFPAGLQLLLGDGCAVSIARGNDRKNPLDEVVVSSGGRDDRLFGAGKAVFEARRSRPWHGPRLFCAGKGDAVYRVVAIGPLVAAERVLVPAADAADLPLQRLVLCTAPLAQSMQLFATRFHGTNAAVRQAAKSVAMLSTAAPHLFEVPADAPFRLAKDEARWSLQGGYQLGLTVDTVGTRLSLHVGEAREALCEWTLGYRSELRLPQQLSEVPGEPTAHFRGNLELPVVVPELQVRADDRELEDARALLRRALK
jgi:hypothetical protein